VKETSNAPKETWKKGAFCLGKLPMASLLQLKEALVLLLQAL
jgi:hypothetical protein